MKDFSKSVTGNFIPLAKRDMVGKSHPPVQIITDRIRQQAEMEQHLRTFPAWQKSRQPGLQEQQQVQNIQIIEQACITKGSMPKP